MNPRIAFLPGEGIGPEIMAEARKVLAALRPFDFEFDALEGQVGGVAYDVTGQPLPDATLDLVRQADAVLFGAVGDPRFDHLERSLRPERAILGLRRELGLYAYLKHVQVPIDLADLSPLRAERVAGLDLLVVRELNGDVYTGQPRGRRLAPDGAFAEPSLKLIGINCPPKAGCSKSFTKQLSFPVSKSGIVRP